MATTATKAVDTSLSVALGSVCNKPLFSDVLFTFRPENETRAITAFGIGTPPAEAAAVPLPIAGGGDGDGAHDDSDPENKKLAVVTGKPVGESRTDLNNRRTTYSGPVIYGHKIILAARSEVFKTMFQTDPNGLFVLDNNRGTGSAACGTWTCNIVDIEPEIFELVMKVSCNKQLIVYCPEFIVMVVGLTLFVFCLQYIYTDTLDTAQLTVEMVLSILYAAKKYLLDGLVTQCTSYLNTKMIPDNIYLLLNSLNLLTDDCVANVDLLIKQ